MAQAKTKAPTQTDLVKLLGELVKFPTLTAETATNKAALDWVKHQVKDLPLHVHDVVHNNVSSLVLTTRPTKHPKVLLLAHIDVNPGPAKLFELRQENGRLYGRGVFDMKMAVAVYMKLLLELGDRLPGYDFGVMLTADEETGGANGVGQLLKDGWRADVVINPDSIGRTGWEIEEAAKGIGYIRVRSQGVAGHGSTPWLARSAIDQLLAFLADLKRHFPAEPCGDPEHFHQTLNVGLIQGGAAFNQVAASASAELDIRITPEITTQAMEALLHDTAARHEGITLDIVVSPVPLKIDRDHEYVRLAELIVAKVTGQPPAFILSHGGTDSRYFAGLSIPNLLFNPPGGGAHSDSEWIDAKGLEQFYQVVCEFVTQVAKTT